MQVAHARLDGFSRLRNLQGPFHISEVDDEVVYVHALRVAPLSPIQYVAPDTTLGRFFDFRVGFLARDDKCTLALRP